MKKTITLILAVVFVLLISVVSVFAVASKKEDVKLMTVNETLPVAETCAQTECWTQFVTLETVTTQKNFVDSNNNSICDNRENNECENYGDCYNSGECDNNYGYQHRNGNCYRNSYCGDSYNNENCYNDDCYEYDYSNGNCNNGGYYEDVDNDNVCDNYGDSKYLGYQHHGGHSKGRHNR